VVAATQVLLLELLQVEAATGDFDSTGKIVSSATIKDDEMLCWRTACAAW
jgi:hypothetical protein